MKVWAYFDAERGAEIHRIEGSFNGARYIELLGNLLNDSNKKSWANSIVFVHDSHPVHKARLVVDWLDSQPEFLVLDWPRNFGDVMPFEILWRDLQTILINKNVRVENAEQLWHSIDTEFRGLTSDLCYLKNLVHPHMSEKLRLVIDSNGGSV